MPLSHYLAAAALLLFILSLRIRHLRRAHVIEIDASRCVGCGACAERCRHSALEIIRDEQGARMVAVRPERCSACGNCIAVCKREALHLATHRRTT